MAWNPIALTVPQYEDANGDPYSGAVLKAYDAGTTTNINLATDSTGGTTVGSIALNASGYPEVSGSIVIPHADRDYKLALYPTQAAADADSGAIWTIDNIAVGAPSVQWQDTGDTLTRISVNSFSVPGDETSKYQVGRRLEITDGSGTKYCTILTSVFTSLTTVTVVVDQAGVLSAGSLTARMSILEADSQAIPAERAPVSINTSTTTLTLLSNYRHFVVTSATGGSITDMASVGVGNVVSIDFTTGVTFAHDGDMLDLPGGNDVTFNSATPGSSCEGPALFYEYDVGKYRLISAVPESPHKVARIASGQYTGDGTGSNAITGLGFKPKYLYIVERVTTASAVNVRMTFESMNDDNASGLELNPVSGNITVGGIISLDADGFTVGGSGTPNASAQDYNYVAMG